jgi:hypothetical protein
MTAAQPHFVKASLRRRHKMAGALRGRSHRRGGSGKAEGFGARGRLPPLDGGNYVEYNRI